MVASETSSEVLTEGDLEFLKDFMNISEAAFFKASVASTDNGDDDIDAPLGFDFANLTDIDAAVNSTVNGSSLTLSSVDSEVKLGLGSSSEETFDFLGVVIFVVCGHFFIKWFVAFFPCFVTCLVPRSNPVRSLKFLYLLFSNLVLYSCLCISFGALQAQSIGYFTANLFVAVGCLCGVESVSVYCSIVEYGEILRRGGGGGLGLDLPPAFDAEAVIVPSAPGTPDADAANAACDLPPSYEEAMAAKMAQQQNPEEPNADDNVVHGANLHMQPSVNSLSYTPDNSYF